jgi:hypothetical protein
MPATATASVSSNVSPISSWRVTSVGTAITAITSTTRRVRRMRTAFDLNQPKPVAACSQATTANRVRTHVCRPSRIIPVDVNPQ